MKRKIKRKLLYLAMSLVIIISLSFSACNSKKSSIVSNKMRESFKSGALAKGVLSTIEFIKNIVFRL